MVFRIYWLNATGLALWVVLTVGLAIYGYAQHNANAPLREQLALQKELNQSLDSYCHGVAKVNDVCEGQFVEVMQRLGLDNEMMPLVTTGLWKRATRGMRVSKARKAMGAKPYATGFLERSQLDHEAIGGPSQGEGSDQ